MSPSPPQSAPGSASRPRRVAVVGGGISGLAAAYFLTRHASPPQVAVYEASPEWGGIVLTESEGGFVMEGGPDAFLTLKPEAAQLCRQLGLQDELMETRPSHRRSYTWDGGRFHPLPTRLLNPPVRLEELRQSPLLSPAGRRRAAEEPSIPKGDSEDESVGDFFRRRFGEEVVRRIAEPLLAGVFGGRVEEISMRAAFPRLWDYEQKHGHLCLEDAAPDGRQERKPRPSPFQTLRGGLGTLISALVKACRDSGCVDLRLTAPVRSVRFRRSASNAGHGCSAEPWTESQPGQPSATHHPPCAGGDEPAFTVAADQAQENFDAVIVAVPAPAAARLLEDGFPQAARILESIPYSPAVLGALAYRGQVLPDLEGSGFIVPPSAGRQLLACTWVHQKWKHRAPEGHSLLRGYLAGQPAGRLMEASEEEITSLIGREFQHLMDIRQEPLFSRVWKLPLALPAYRLGHRARIDSLEDELRSAPGLYCIGNYLDGVGLPDCIRHARAAARSVDAS
ncbi:MAG TPA: protoporphyrinogen oxidase [Acidobacteriota bacterium]|nr:protoporphyrinogen oxidase [Acidobacteriota bacterium]